MIKAKVKQTKISETEIDITTFSGLNTFGPHADIKKHEQRALDNYDLYQTYIKSRRGSINFINDTTPGTNILSRAIFKDSVGEYLVIQQTSGTDSAFNFIELTPGATWDTIKDKATGLIPYVITGSTAKADMFVSNGKVYIIHPSANSIFEKDGSTFKRRRIGMPAPQIITVNKVASGNLKGKRVYGVELVYKDTTVTPNVPIVVSGPNRALAVTNPLQGEGALAYTTVDTFSKYTLTLSATLNDGTLITDTSNSFWTHLKVWRSKDVTTATNAAPDLTVESEITGRPDELFQVKEYTKAQILSAPIFDVGSNTYTLLVDDLLDDAMPFPSDIVTGSRLDMVPMPNGTTGVYQNDRIWISGVTKLPGPAGLIVPKNIESKIYYTPESDTIYSENMRVDNAVEAEPGDGQKLVALFNFRNDLIGIKEGKTGRVRNANPSLGWITEDEVTGIPDKEFAQFVPDIGICARVSDQKDFKIFGFNLQWTSTFADQSISRPIRNIIKTFENDDIDFLYINGKLMVSGGKGTLLVLATEQRSGWSQYVYPFNEKSEAVFTYDNGSKALIVNAGQPIIQIEAEDGNGDYINTDYNPVTGLSTAISLPLTTWRFQSNEGRSLIEERYISIVAAASAQIKVQAFVNGKLWQPIFPLLLNPEDYPEIALKETEYQGYEEYRAIGNYIHYEITTTAPCTIYSIMLNALIQRGSIRPGFDPFEVIPSNAPTSPAWAANITLITEDGLAGSDTVTEDGLPGSDTITEITE